MDSGLIHVYYGYGKGKTSSAIGLAVRASGHNKKILMTSFLKDFSSGECSEIRKYLNNITLFECSAINKFFKDMTAEEKVLAQKHQHKAFVKTIEKAITDSYDILVLDELIDIIDLQCITQEEVLTFLKAKPNSLEIVITGHSKNAELIELADYVTEFKCLKHPFSRGIDAREGIEK